MKLTTSKVFALQTAYECSTKSSNWFLPELEKLKCNDRFFADGEWYFTFDNAIFTTPSLDPFKCDWKPSVMWRDDMSVCDF